MNTYTIDSLMEMAVVANGRRRNRTIGEIEAGILLDLLEKAKVDEKIKEIRVYSRQGFVANAYRSRCDISYFSATRHGDEFRVSAYVTDAKRSHGQGALVTVNGRGI